jgi:biotin operon repressor
LFPVGRRIEVSAPDLNFAIPIESIDNRRLYRQIADQISRLIESGEYHAGERLPVERVLAEQLSVSRPTVREALIALKMEGRAISAAVLACLCWNRALDRRGPPQPARCQCRGRSRCCSPVI